MDTPAAHRRFSLPRPRRNLVGRGPVTAALLISLAVTSCGGTAEVARRHTGGPLNAGGSPATQCLRERGSHDYTFGGTPVINTGRRPLTVTGIELVKARGLRLQGADFVQVGHTLVGSASEYPPPSDVLAIPGIQWDQRVKATGARLAPDVQYNLVAHLTRKSLEEAASLARIRIEYEAGSTPYVANTDLALVVKPVC